jgi:hypothetical protein
MTKNLSKEYKDTIVKWSQYWKNKCQDLIWHENKEIIFKKND